MIKGCYTALVTPFKGDEVDYEGLDSLVDFQIKNGVAGILAVGTTGESPTLTWEEHNRVIENVAAKTKGRCLCIAGTGSNNTKETIEATGHAAECGADAVLLVDPYYNGPSSLEIRREYIEPVAREFPDMQIIPYVIPGRTGAQLLPEDLAILSREFHNVNTVKEATGNIENMRRTRECCGPGYSIMSGDDGMVFQMMTDPDIKASGVISVLSNIVPGAISELLNLIGNGEIEKAEKLHSALKPLFELVTVSTMEATPFGETLCRARNPLAVKTLMSILGMPSGGCRKPLGKMTQKGVEKVLSVIRRVYEATPVILKPLEDFFDVKIAKRLAGSSNWEGLSYDEY
ncbi:MAG: 4-hydroxy-tetrahydrodipicolinate synthase [Deltaproteobacteria bacterium]|nr:4-hydroxy-tetrahydrodipicolinate synthase [Deltaproteobacteria bacterium]